MKTSESRPGTKPKRSATGTRTAKTKTTELKAVKSKSVRSKTAVPEQPFPDDEAIGRKAYEIYTERMLRGEQGTAHDDWIKARDILTKS